MRVQPSCKWFSNMAGEGSQPLCTLGNDEEFDFKYSISSLELSLTTKLGDISPTGRH